MTHEWQHLRTKDIKPIELSKAWVVTMCSNPGRYRSRYDSHRHFVKHMADSGANLLVVEVAYGKRPFEVTEPGNPNHVQLRSEHEEVWLKEPCQNIGMRRIPDPEWEYVIFSDNDISYANPIWLSETVHELQSHLVVQPFSQAQDLGPNYEIIQTHNGFAASYHVNNFHGPQGAGHGGYYGYGLKKFWHPGYAMAFRREVFEGGAMPGLLETGVLGSGDHHMWLAMIGEAWRSMPKGVSEQYSAEVMRWQGDSERVIKRDIGFVPGTIFHEWGGPKKKRFYVPRWDIIEECKFNPLTDIRKDWQGLPQLVVEDARQRRQRDLFRKYFRMRDEDSKEV